MQGTTAFLNSSDRHVWAVDVADPSSPQILGSVALPAPGLFVEASGSFAYAITSYSFEVIDIGDPTHMRIQNAATLQIFDLGGRIVRNLTGELRRSERGIVVWNGTDEGGRRLPSGMYIWRFESDGRTETQKLILTR